MFTQRTNLRYPGVETDTILTARENNHLGYKHICGDSQAKAKSHEELCFAANSVNRRRISRMNDQRLFVSFSFVSKASTFLSAGSQSPTENKIRGKLNSNFAVKDCTCRPVVLSRSVTRSVTMFARFSTHRRKCRR